MVISKNILNFLKVLYKNNNREWFNANKNVYNKARLEYEMFVELLIQKINQFDEDIGTLSAKDVIYRIYRDIRFSNDKTPYKTHFGAYITKRGRTGGYAGYYLHVEPGGSFLAGGIYMPPSDILKRLRTDIYENIEEFKAIINNSDFRKCFSNLWGEKLKSPPRGFPKDFPDIELLKYKHYIVAKNVTEDELQDKDFLETATGVFKILMPFNGFINNSIDYGP